MEIQIFLASGNWLLVSKDNIHIRCGMWPDIYRFSVSHDDVEEFVLALKGQLNNEKMMAFLKKMKEVHDGKAE